MRTRDLISEALAGLLARPLQATVTIVGTAVGIGTLVATIAIAKTAGNQFIIEVGALAPTDITVTVGEPTKPDIEIELGWAAEAAVRRIDGIVQAGAVAEITNGPDVRTAPVMTNESLAGNVRVFAASPGLLQAVGARFISGRAFDHGHVRRADPVALVGTAAAAQLGLRPGATLEAIFLGDQPLVVMGIFDTRIAPELITSVVVTSGFAQEQLGVSGPTQLHITTQVGATAVVARQIGIALMPQDPAAISVTHGPQPTRTAGRVAHDVDVLFLLVGALSLLVASFGIANTSLVTVMERRPEIGLRRALGFRRRDIGAIFLAEAAALGALGGTMGASGGLVTTVIIAAVRDWTPVLDPWLPVAATIVGMLVGVAAGLYPAARAMTTEPVAALNSLHG